MNLFLLLLDELLSGRNRPSSELSLVDIARLQRADLASRALVDHEVYWVKRLAGVVGRPSRDSHTPAPRRAAAGDGRPRAGRVQCPDAIEDPASRQQCALLCGRSWGWH